MIPNQFAVDTNMIGKPRASGDDPVASGTIYEKER